MMKGFEMYTKRMAQLVLGIFLGVAACGNSWAQKFEGLASTPQMGWNSWNKFACDIDERLIRETADAMVKTGMKDAGYQYVNIDDCWQGERDADGNIQPDPKRFPSGMKALADYVHGKGLKLGIYSDGGATTCGGRPGSRGHEYQDARTYARWGIDYLKYDWCNTQGLNAEGAYTTMRDAIAKAGRPMLFSACEWGISKPWEWAGQVAHSWRTTPDIYNCFDCEFSPGLSTGLGVLRILDRQAGLRKFAGPGHWNDMDMLEVGNGMSEDEDRAHLSIWAMMASPLILGNDLRTMSESTRRILTNPGVIAVNQDRLGVQALRVMADGPLEIYAKPLDGGQWALMFLNRSNQPVDVRHDWKAEVLTDGLSNRSVDFKRTVYRWSDLWSTKTGDTSVNLQARLAPHSVLMLLLTGPTKPQGV
ncbi:glycoside hydrolase family 27 protein [Sphingomonas caeni]|uniref:glycoside hydrolase family 27 protein n=1 Tax=Sphingomonas caeni TaxID=2984949 RepID=UPI00222E0BAC|nr:glycoside hydrolase family 27 protein [Sphingomonas caeni]